MHSTTALDDYPALLRAFREAGYSCAFFPEWEGNARTLLLRHDVDFDVAAALELAHLEHAQGMVATYFFLLSSDSYNPFTRDNRERIREIRALGHRVSLHFDPAGYDDFEDGLRQEAGSFERQLGGPVEIISLHRPGARFLAYDAPIGGIPHTYQTRYFRDIAYYSDSGGSFRHGHPLDSGAFREGRSLQLLIHPVWWTYPGDRPQDILRAHYASRKAELRAHYARHCAPFQDIADELD